LLTVYGLYCSPDTVIINLRHLFLIKQLRERGKAEVLFPSAFSPERKRIHARTTSSPDPCVHAASIARPRLRRAIVDLRCTTPLPLLELRPPRVPLLPAAPHALSEIYASPVDLLRGPAPWSTPAPGRCQPRATCAPGLGHHHPHCRPRAWPLHC
jgi:hypothetical protein